MTAPPIVRLEQVPSYQEFFDEYLLPNRPCVLPAALISSWPVLSSWRLPSLPDAEDLSTSLPNWSHLSSSYGHLTAPALLPDNTRVDLRISTSISRIQNGESLYIKDWHLSPPCPVPSLFADDWMNNLSPGVVDDFRFVYAGAKGTRTGLHRDVYTSYSWSTNVVGVKRWRLFPPHVKRGLRRFPDVRTSEIAETTEQRPQEGYPLWEEAMDAMQQVIQHQGETIFVPSDWYHEVQNLTDCVSINRNWCNAVNLPSMYESMVQEVQDVSQSLQDVKVMIKQTGGEWEKEFTKTVQEVARQDAGWAWEGFWKMVEWNLKQPATEYRPERRFISERLRPLMKDFEKRQEYAFLDEEIRQCAKRCKMLL